MMDNKNLLDLVVRNMNYAKTLVLSDFYDFRKSKELEMNEEEIIFNFKKKSLSLRKDLEFVDSQFFFKLKQHEEHVTLETPSFLNRLDAVDFNEPISIKVFVDSIDDFIKHLYFNP